MKEDNNKLEQEKYKIQEKKMIMELNHADIVDDYEIKMKKMTMEMNALRTKMKKFKTHAINKDMHLHYALRVLAILVTIIFPMYASYLFNR